MKTEQSSKLRVHPAPGVYHLAAGCTHFGACAPGECTFRVAKFDPKIGSRRTTEKKNLVVLVIILVVLILLPHY